MESIHSQLQVLGHRRRNCEREILRGIICMHYTGPTKNLAVQEKKFPRIVTGLICQEQIKELLQVY